MGRYIVAISGASGAIYGVRLLRTLLETGHAVHLTMTAAAAKIIGEEMQIAVDPANGEEVVRALGCAGASDRLFYHREHEVDAPIASGSFKTDGMAVAPCSMGTLGRIASGVSGNLIERAADVMLKERRPLVVVPRETPLNDIHLENMLRLRRAGATILPAMPGFYHRPERVIELVDFVVSRILDHLRVDNDLVRRYTGIDDAPIMRDGE